MALGFTSFLVLAWSPEGFAQSRLQACIEKTTAKLGISADMAYQDCLRRGYADYSQRPTGLACERYCSYGLCSWRIVNIDGKVLKRYLDSEDDCLKIKRQFSE